MAMSPEEQARFFNRGRDLMTGLAQVVEQLDAYAETFEARGGAAELGDYGNDTTAIVYLRNDLDQFLDEHDNGAKRVTMARLRQDY